MLIKFEIFIFMFISYQKSELLFFIKIFKQNYQHFLSN